MFKIFFLSLFSLSCFSSDYFYNKGEKIAVTKLNEIRTLRDKDIHYYQTSRGEKIGVSNDIILECHKNTECQNVLKDFGFLMIQNITDVIYVVTLKDKENIFEISSKLYEHKEIKYAHPNFIKTRTKR